MDTSSPVSALAYAIALCQTNCSNWEGAFKKASQHADELSAKVYYLEMELAAARSHNASLVRENNRLTLSLRHMMPFGTTPPSSPLHQLLTAEGAPLAEPGRGIEEENDPESLSLDKDDM